jgi:hypothetical protein
MADMWAFFTTNVNMGALAGLLLITVLFFFSKGNTKFGLIFGVIFIGYLLFVNHKIENDPEFLTRLQEKTEALDVEKIFWGETGGKLRDASENRGK